MIKINEYGRSFIACVQDKCCAAAKWNNRSDKLPNLCVYVFPKDLKTRKEWELCMQRVDILLYKSGDHKFCCSEQFCPTNFKVGLTGHRRQLKLKGDPQANSSIK